MRVMWHGALCAMVGRQRGATVVWCGEAGLTHRGGVVSQKRWGGVMRGDGGVNRCGGTPMRRRRMVGGRRAYLGRGGIVLPWRGEAGVRGAAWRGGGTGCCDVAWHAATP